MKTAPVMIISTTSIITAIIAATIIGGSQQLLIVGLPLLMIVKNLRLPSVFCSAEKLWQRAGRDIDAT